MDCNPGPRTNRPRSPSQAEEGVLPEMDPDRLRKVRVALLYWYRQHGRNLPWRHTRDPYAVLVSEVMLQQTQVDRVLPKWHAWLEQFPTILALASASRAEVIRAWSGLGYNLRAVRLHDIAKQAVERFGGALPGTLPDLLALKGIGRYTAGAVACFAFEQPVAMVDTNVRRVLGRVFWGNPQVGAEQARAIQRLAEAVLPLDEPFAWNQALMDLGATLCTASRPACLPCPLVAVCAAAPRMATWRDERRRILREGRALYNAGARQRSDRQRYYRGRVIAALRGLDPAETLALGDLAPRVKADFTSSELPWLEATVRKLAREGLLVVTEDPTGDPANLQLRLPQ
jgi:A/G-specific adenine glycosylase